MSTPTVGSQWRDTTHKDLWTVITVHPNGAVTIRSGKPPWGNWGLWIERVVEASFLVGAYQPA